MTKQEFLDSLRAALASRVNASMVAENVRYYEDYINTQMRMGKSEEEVLKELGDPRLLARSIAEANKHAGTGQAQDVDYRNVNGDNNGQGYGRNTGYHSQTFRMPGWLIAVIVIIVIVLILSAVFSVLSFLAPVLLPILCVLLLVRVFRHTS
ncbi:MAG: DUF1700 domain-containing protein [Lachnospiraceae bacterium]